MAVERVDKPDRIPYQVQETRDDRRRQGEAEQGPQEKDAYDKKPPIWKRILSLGTESGRSSPLLMGRKKLSLPTGGPSDEEESSLTLTERLLAIWGILDANGHPRPGVILVYAFAVGMILGAILLIFVMTLWL